MLEIAQLTAEKISTLDVLSRSGVGAAVEQMQSLSVSRLVVTDQNGYIIFDTAYDPQYKFAVFPQIVEALQGNNVFTWRYRNATMYSEAATPIVSYGVTIGCVYMMEFDREQGAVIHSLQMTILTISAILELIVLIYSIVFSRSFSKRMRKIMDSMHTIQEGNYTHFVTPEGNDELAFLAKEFNTLADRLQISENKRSQFVSDASHELKTPLATIKLLSDSIMQNDMDMQTVREFVADIGNEADRLNRVAQKLLDLTRGENPGEDNVREIIYMGPTVYKVVRMISPLAESQKVSLVTQLEEDTTILIREDDFYRIIFNLAENGIKYNVPQGTLTIRLSRDDEYGYVEVADSGVGIPENSLGKIFERFYRVDKARSRATGGSGLGLSIVRNMVERNEGVIHVDSELGKGTIFKVGFPLFDMEVDKS